VIRATRRMLLCSALIWPAAAFANHDWGGIDVCTVYRNTAPPGFDPAALPQSSGTGALLLTRYCTQCHALPGPGHHTAAEWPAVLERMQVLMDTSRRFRGLMGSIAAPDADERATLRAYLSANALAPMRGSPHGPGAEAFASHCASCHALPDPRQHPAADWPAVVTRMQGNTTIMQRGDMSPEAQVAIIGYLQAAVSDRLAGDARAGGVQLARAGTVATASSYGITRLAILVPFFALAGLGMLRWWYGAHRRRTGNNQG
jgi:cytochrome c5